MVVLISLLTTSLKKVEDKMSASNIDWSEEEMIVAVVGGRVRRLV